MAVDWEAEGSAAEMAAEPVEGWAPATREVATEAVVTEAAATEAVETEAVG